MQQFMERSRKEISFASSKVDREPSLSSKLSQISSRGASWL
jgi:hypothetical protein